MPWLIFILFTTAIMLAGHTAFESYKQSIKQNAQNELGGIAELKNRQIVYWMQERLGDAKTLREDPLFLHEAEHWLQQGGPTGKSKTNLAARLASLQHTYHDYASISLFDNQGVLRLSTSAGEAQTEGLDKQHLLESMRNGEIEFSDIHWDGANSGERMEIEISAPLITLKNGKARTIGAVLFRINPSLFLFPLIERWPTPSDSAENILVRREGDAVVFLNQVRHIRNIPLVMHLPLSETQLLETKAAQGQQGLVEGMDYRGVQVVGVLSQVAGTSWVMVSKIDKAEIYASINQLANGIAALMLVFVATGAAIAVYWRKKERKQYEHELERQVLAKHLDYLAKYSNDIILLLDAAGKIVDFNDRALDAYGYSAAEFRGVSVDATRAIGLSLPVAERLRKIDEAGGALVFESTHVRRNGETFPVESSVRRIDIAGERFYQTINRDITERKKAEEMLRFHSAILNNLSEGVFLVRIDNGTVIFTNPQFERMFGYGPGELLGKNVSVLNAPGLKSPEIVAKEINEAVAENGVWIGELQNVRKDGSTFWCQASVSAFEHPQYGKIGISVHEDITERKNLERGLHERRKEMDELQKLHVAAQTASAIAHELNQPLLAIASYCKAAQLMLKSKKPDFGEICRAIEGSERQAQRAGQSIRELFDFLNSSEFPIEEFDLVQEIVLILDDARKEHELVFQSSLRVEETLPLVRANRTHVQKALFNLLRNGIEAAMHASGVPLPVITVTVGRAEEGRFAQVTVQDNGPGFSAEDAQHLFEPFFTTKGDGFGMGLSISRSLIEMNGGRLWVAPQESPGAIFHLTIPFAGEPSR